MPGKVIIQTYNPDNFTIQCSKEQNYEKFYETEIALRKQLKYPPFCDIIVVNCNSEIANEASRASNWVYNQLYKSLPKEFKIFKPMPSPIDKIQNRYRFRVIAKGNVTNTIRQLINNCLTNSYDLKLKGNTRVIIDVNPNSMV